MLLAEGGMDVTSSAVGEDTLLRLWLSTRNVGVSLSGVVRSNANSAGEEGTTIHASDYSGSHILPVNTWNIVSAIHVHLLYIIHT